MSMFHIRKAEAGDVPLILTLVRELAEYERERDAVVATEEDLLRHGFGESPRFHVLLAEEGAEVLGFAFYFFTFSTWRGTPVLYLEDIFVRPEHRRKKAGVALMRRLAAEAVERGCDRFIWQVLDWNEPAIRFYESLGARAVSEWVTMRLEGEALKAFAAP